RSSGTCKDSILRTTPATGRGRGRSPSVAPGKVSTRRGGSCSGNAVYSIASVIWTVMRTFSPNVSVLIPVITARLGAPWLSARGGDSAGCVTLQPTHHRAVVRMPMNTPERRWERFTCLSFLFVLAPKRERKRFGDELVFRVQILFLD